jgi:putative peptidoglycan lipid II flippase
LVRDIVITGLLGAGVALDTFVVIMKIPSVFRRLFAEGAFNQAFVPVLAEYKEKNQSQIASLINNTFGTLCAILLLVTILALLLRPIFVMIFAPGFLYRAAKKRTSYRYTPDNFSIFIFCFYSGLFRFYS